MSLLMFFFFFSSRRRHTRCYRDWSSECALPILIGAGRGCVDGPGGALDDRPPKLGGCDPSLEHLLQDLVGDRLSPKVDVNHLAPAQGSPEDPAGIAEGLIAG